MHEGNRQGQSTQEAVTEELIGERRLWLAVVMQAVEEWRNGTLRNRRKAQEFIFSETRDFAMVCSNAGLDPDSLRSRLMRIGQMVSAHGPILSPLAA
jgi:hypothetical protein